MLTNTASVGSEDRLFYSCAMHRKFCIMFVFSLLRENIASTIAHGQIFILCLISFTANDILLVHFHTLLFRLYNV